MNAIHNNALLISLHKIFKQAVQPHLIGKHGV